MRLLSEFCILPLLGIALLTYSILSTEYPLHAQESIVKCKKLTESDLLKHEHEFIISPLKGQFDNEQLPILLLYHDNLESRIDQTPQLYFALWRDGTIVWVKTKDRNLFIPYTSKVDYYQSTLSENDIEQFFLSVDKTGIRNFSGKYVSPIGSTHCQLFFETKDESFNLAIYYIDWPNPPYDWPPKQIWDHEMAEIAEKWQSVHKLIHELIPNNGEKVHLSIKKRPEKYEWLGIACRVCCDSPSSVLPPENDVSNGDLVQDLCPTQKSPN